MKIALYLKDTEVECHDTFSTRPMRASWLKTDHGDKMQTFIVPLDDLPLDNPAKRYKRVTVMVEEV